MADDIREISGVPRILPASPNEGVLAYPVPFSGLNTEQPGRLIPRGEAHIADNAWLRDGAIETSGGTATVAATPSATTTAEDLGKFQYVTFDSSGVATRRWLKVARIDSGTAKLYALESGLWVEKGNISGTSPCDFKQALNKVYIASGGATVQTWDGTTLANLVTAVTPNAIALGDDTIGFGPPGPEWLDGNWNPINLVVGATYGLAYSLYNSATGEESSLSNIVTHTFAGVYTGIHPPSPLNTDAIICKVPDRVSAEWDSIRTYRSAANDAANVRLERTIGGPWWMGNARNVSFGIKADSALGGSATPTASSSLAGVRGLEFWDGRMWYFGIKEKPTTIYYSRRENFSVTPLSNNIILADDVNGEDIRCLMQHEKRLYVFKSRRSFVVVPGKTLEYEARPVDTGYGIVSRHAACIANNMIYAFGVGCLLRFDGSGFVLLAPGAATYLEQVTRGAGWEQPLYLRHDWSPWRSRLVFGTHVASGGSYSDGTDSLAGFVHVPDGAITKNTAYPQRCTSLAVGERDGASADNRENRAWLLGGARFSKVGIGPGLTTTTYELFETSAGARIRGNGLDYQTGYMDPDPRFRHKMFYGCDVLLERTPSGVTAGSLTATVSYDDGNATESAQTIPELSSASARSTILVPIRFVGATTYETAALRLTASDGNLVNHFRVLGVKFYWTPKGSLSPVL